MLVIVGNGDSDAFDTGGVVGMPDFLEKFFPSVLANIDAGGRSA